MTAVGRVLLCALVLTAAGCSARSTTPATTPAEATGEFEPTTSVRWVRDSAEHRALFLQIYRAATAHVETEAARRQDRSWGVVVDADETVIDNVLYQVEREQQGLGFTGESWREWTTRQEAVPLPGAKAFLDRVRDLGGHIAIVTNRRVSECPDTEAVFHAHGLAYDVILCRPDDGPGDKNPRFESVRRGTTPAGLPPLDVVAFLGDNIHDFPGQSQSLREKEEAAFADFGARFFVLPNPMYGGWE